MSSGENQEKFTEVDEAQVARSVNEAPTKPVSKFTRWYRSPLFNVIIVGLISFTQPGIWNALNCKSSWVMEFT